MACPIATKTTINFLWDMLVNKWATESFVKMSSQVDWLKAQLDAVKKIKESLTDGVSIDAIKNIESDLDMSIKAKERLFRSSVLFSVFKNEENLDWVIETLKLSWQKQFQDVLQFTKEMNVDKLLNSQEHKDLLSSVFKWEFAELSKQDIEDLNKFIQARFSYEYTAKDDQTIIWLNKAINSLFDWTKIPDGNIEELFNGLKIDYEQIYDYNTLIQKIELAKDIDEAMSLFVKWIPTVLIDTVARSNKFYEVYQKRITELVSDGMQVKYSDEFNLFYNMIKSVSETDIPLNTTDWMTLAREVWTIRNFDIDRKLTPEKLRKFRSSLMNDYETIFKAEWEISEGTKDMLRYKLGDKKNNVKPPKVDEVTNEDIFNIPWVQKFVLSYLWYWEDLLWQDAYMNWIIDYLVKTKTPDSKNLTDIISNETTKISDEDWTIKSQKKYTTDIQEIVKKELTKKTKIPNQVILTDVLQVWDLDLKKTVFIDLSYKANDDLAQLKFDEQDLGMRKTQTNIKLNWYSYNDYVEANDELKQLIASKADKTAEPKSELLKWIKDGSIKNILVSSKTKESIISWYARWEWLQPTEWFVQRANKFFNGKKKFVWVNYPAWKDTYMLELNKEWLIIKTNTEREHIFMYSALKASLWDEAIKQLWMATPDGVALYKEQARKVLEKMYPWQSDAVKEYIDLYYGSKTKSNINRLNKITEWITNYMVSRKVIDLNSVRNDLDNMSMDEFVEIVSRNVEMAWERYGFNTDWIKILESDRQEVSNMFVDSVYTKRFEDKARNREKLFKKLWAIDWWSPYNPQDYEILFAKTVDWLESKWIFVPTFWKTQTVFNRIIKNWHEIYWEAPEVLFNRAKANPEVSTYIWSILAKQNLWQEEFDNVLRAINNELNIQMRNGNGSLSNISILTTKRLEPTIIKMTPLHEEARKYGSAEEFIDSWKSLYHGTYEDTWRTIDELKTKWVKKTSWYGWFDEPLRVYFTDTKWKANALARDFNLAKWSSKWIAKTIETNVVWEIKDIRNDVLYKLDKDFFNELLKKTMYEYKWKKNFDNRDYYIDFINAKKSNEWINSIVKEILSKDKYDLYRNYNVKFVNKNYYEVKEWFSKEDFDSAYSNWFNMIMMPQFKSETSFWYWHEVSKSLQGLAKEKWYAWFRLSDSYESFLESYAILPEYISYWKNRDNLKQIREEANTPKQVGLTAESTTDSNIWLFYTDSLDRIDRKYISDLHLLSKDDWSKLTTTEFFSQFDTTLDNYLELANERTTKFSDELTDVEKSQMFIDAENIKSEYVWEIWKYEDMLLKKYKGFITSSDINSMKWNIMLISSSADMPALYRSVESMKRINNKMKIQLEAWLNKTLELTAEDKVAELTTRGFYIKVENTIPMRVQIEDLIIKLQDDLKTTAVEHQWLDWLLNKDFSNLPLKDRVEAWKTLNLIKRTMVDWLPIEEKILVEAHPQNADTIADKVTKDTWTKFKQYTVPQSMVERSEIAENSLLTVDQDMRIKESILNKIIANNWKDINWIVDIVVNANKDIKWLWDLTAYTQELKNAFWPYSLTFAEVSDDAIQSFKEWDEVSNALLNETLNDIRNSVEDIELWWKDVSNTVSEQVPDRWDKSYLEYQNPKETEEQKIIKDKNKWDYYEDNEVYERYTIDQKSLDDTVIERNDNENAKRFVNYTANKWAQVREVMSIDRWLSMIARGLDNIKDEAKNTAGALLRMKSLDAKSQSKMFEEMKNWLEQMFNDTTYNLDIVDSLWFDPTVSYYLKTIWSYFNSLRDVVLRSWIEEEVFVWAANRIWKYMIDKMSNIDNFSKWISVIENNMFLAMMKSDSMFNSKFKLWNTDTEIADFAQYSRSLFPSLWDNSIKLIYDNFAEPYYIIKSKRLRDTTNFLNKAMRLTLWLSLWMITNAGMQWISWLAMAANRRLFQEWDWWYQYFDEIAEIIWWWGWNMVLESLEWSLNYAWNILWLTKQLWPLSSPEQKIRMFVSMMDVWWEIFGSWLQQWADIMLKTERKMKAMYDAVTKNWFIDMKHFNDWLKQAEWNMTPQKTLIIERVKSDANKSLDISIWISWMTSTTERWAYWRFKNLFDFRGSRWLSKIYHTVKSWVLWADYVRNVLSEMVKGSKNWRWITMYQAIRKANKKFAKHKEYTSIYRDIITTSYLNQKIRHVFQDENDEENLKSEFLSLFNARKTSYENMAAFWSTALTRMAWYFRDIWADIVKWEKSWGRIALDTYNSIIWEFLKQSKGLSRLLSWTIEAWLNINDRKKFIQSIMDIFADDSLWYYRFLNNKIVSKTDMTDMPAYWLSAWETLFWNSLKDTIMNKRYDMYSDVEFKKLSKLWEDWDVWLLAKTFIKESFFNKLHLTKAIMKTYSKTVEIDDLFNRMEQDETIRRIRETSEVPISNIIKDESELRNNYLRKEFRTTLTEPKYWLLGGGKSDKRIEAMRQDPVVNRNDLLTNVLNNLWDDKKVMEYLITNETSYNDKSYLEAIALMSVAKNYWAWDDEIYWLTQQLTAFTAKALFYKLQQQKKDKKLDKVKTPFWTLDYWNKWDIEDLDVQDEVMKVLIPKLWISSLYARNDLVASYTAAKYSEELKDFVKKTETKSADWLTTSTSYDIAAKYAMPFLALNVMKQDVLEGKNMKRFSAFASQISYLDTQVKVEMFKDFSDFLDKNTVISEVEKRELKDSRLVLNPDMITRSNDIRAIDPEAADRRTETVREETKDIDWLAQALMAWDHVTWKSNSGGYSSYYGNMKWIDIPNLAKNMNTVSNLVRSQWDTYLNFKSTNKNGNGRKQWLYYTPEQRKFFLKWEEYREQSRKAAKSKSYYDISGGWDRGKWWVKIVKPKQSTTSAANKKYKRATEG